MEVANDTKQRGLTIIFEKMIRIFGKKKRFVDLAGLDADENLSELHQVGKQNKNLQPVKRERVIMTELEKVTGIKPIFHAYNNIEGKKSEK